MTYPELKIKLPCDILGLFPDGDYTAGRGADPRGILTGPLARATTTAKTPRARKPQKRRGKVTPPAAAE